MTYWAVQISREVEGGLLNGDTGILGSNEGLVYTCAMGQKT